MNPERKNNAGVKHWSNPELGVEEDQEFSPLCKFHGDDFRLRAMEKNTGKTGYIVGYIREIVGSPRYELLLLDDTKTVIGVHDSMLEIVENVEMSPFTDPSRI